MKQIKFDARFKDAILSKTMVATIRNDKKVDVGEVFEIVIDNNVVGKAECICLYKFHYKKITESLYKSFDLGLFRTTKRVLFDSENVKILLSGNSGCVNIKIKSLGFKTSREALNHYLNYVQEHCYLHIFELTEEYSEN
jgi:hypothetical protein